MREKYLAVASHKHPEDRTCNGNGTCDPSMYGLVLWPLSTLDRAKVLILETQISEF